jgi:hypothetical protein
MTFSTGGAPSGCWSRLSESRCGLTVAAQGAAYRCESLDRQWYECSMPQERTGNAAVPDM